jgi:hypothetical protein
VPFFIGENMKKNSLTRDVKTVLGMDSASKQVIHALLTLENNAAAPSEKLFAVENKTAGKQRSPKERWTFKDKQELYTHFNRMFKFKVPFTIETCIALSKKFNRTYGSISAQYYKWEQKCQLLETYLNNITAATK